MTDTIPTRYGPLLAPGRGSDLVETFLRSAAPLGSPGNEMIWQRLMAAEARAAAAAARLASLGIPPSGTQPSRKRDPAGNVTQPET